MKLSSKIIFTIVILIIVISSIILLRNKDRFDPNQQVIDITIENKKLIKPKEPIQITLGKKVTFLISSDEDEQFHLEGYHAFTSFKGGMITKLQFDALTPGNFKIYLDKSRTYLGSVEIAQK